MKLLPEDDEVQAFPRPAGSWDLLARCHPKVLRPFPFLWRFSWGTVSMVILWPLTLSLCFGLLTRVSHLLSRELLNIASPGVLKWTICEHTDWREWRLPKVITCILVTTLSRVTVLEAILPPHTSSPFLQCQKISPLLSFQPSVKGTVQALTLRFFLLFFLFSSFFLSLNHKHNDNFNNYVSALLMSL